MCIRDRAGHLGIDAVRFAYRYADRLDSTARFDPQGFGCLLYTSFSVLNRKWGFSWLFRFFSSACVLSFSICCFSASMRYQLPVILIATASPTVKMCIRDRCCMAVELLPGGLEGVSGTVRYPRPFME